MKLQLLAGAVLTAAGVLGDASQESCPEWVKAETKGQIAAARAAREELAPLAEKLRAEGKAAYADMQIMVLDKFLKWIHEEDIPRGWTNRVEREAREIAEIGTEAVEEAKAVLAGTREGFAVPRYVTSPVRLFHAQTIATRKWPDGHVEASRPVFLNGFGHFSRVRAELADLPTMGYHLLQNEVNWRVYQPQDNLRKPQYVKELFTDTADRAFANDVRFDLLLSPHYFPNWAKERWMKDLTCSGGFFGYCVHHPEIRQAIRRYFQDIVSIVGEHPALNSICVSNEPRSEKVSKCPFVREGFTRWLAQRYGTVVKMNALWRTAYASFAEVPVPEHPNLPATPESLEFVRYNRESFAEFHAFLAQSVREIAPHVPLHSKVVLDEGFSRGRGVFWSVDFERFAEIFDYLDGDPLNFYRNWGEGHYLNRWEAHQAGYDFMRSMADKPFYNSENHNIEDRWRPAIPGVHIQSALWQDAIHGQAATAVWNYERAVATNQSCFGLILERPRCLYAQNRCALDLNRLADRLAPIQNQKAGVVVLWSLASHVLGGSEGKQSKAFLSSYAAASCLGQQVGIVTERRLERFAETGERVRPLEEAKVVILPEVAHLSDLAYRGLKRLESEGVAVVAVGKPLDFDDFGNVRTGRRFPQLTASLDDPEIATAMFDAMHRWELRDLPRVREPNSARPVFGVETHGYRRAGKAYLSVVNHTRKPVDVRLPGAGKDLITGDKLTESLRLEPLRPIFAEIEERP